MCTFSETKPVRPPRPQRLRSALRSRLPHGRGEDGFLLVEVLVSAMLVALIVTATFNGLDVAHRLTADQRRHDQASILASQSQEQLRSEPASALNALVSSPHKYTKTVGGTTYTITQEAKNVGASGKTTGCSVTETKAQTGTNFQTSSTVTWKSQEKAKRPAVKASGIVTPPTGSAVEIDVINGLNEGVSGVTAKATFIPFEAGSYNTVEGTTGNAGCVVLTGIQSTSATIEIVEKTGFVMPSGALKVPSKEIAIAPNITTHYTVQYAEAGRIAAHFTYKGEATWEGKTVVGDTFVAYNTNIGIKPEYETGATYFKYEATGEEKFLPLTAKALASATPSQKPYLYEPIAWTAAGSKYPKGDLFPFKEKWLVYGGDCSANNTGTEARAEAGPVKSGEEANVNVPLSFTKLSIWTGTSSTKKGELTSKRYGPAKITNTECESATTPPNATGIAFTHEQKETLPEGRLEEPFQPFGNNFKLCVVNSELKRTYTVPFSNTTVAGSTPNIYIGQRTGSEISTDRTTQQTKYETEKTNYTNLKGKYETEKTNYTNLKGKYETEKTNYTTLKSKYETKKAEYEAKKKEYEKNKKLKEKEEYEKLQTEYKKYEAEYKAAETAYKKYETEYKTAETNYKKYETEYKTAETKYKEYEAAYLGFKAEEEEAGTTGVTVAAGTTC